jgi:hypothetical protein
MTPVIAALRAEHEAEKRAQQAEEAARLEAAHAGRMLNDFLVSKDVRGIRKSLVECLLDCIRRHEAKIWGRAQYCILIEACPDDWCPCTPEEIAAGIDNTYTIWRRYEEWPPRRAVRVGTGSSVNNR